jgi:hypothetical protein
MDNKDDGKRFMGDWVFEYNNRPDNNAYFSQSCYYGSVMASSRRPKIIDIEEL